MVVKDVILIMVWSEELKIHIYLEANKVFDRLTCITQGEDLGVSIWRTIPRDVSSCVLKDMKGVSFPRPVCV